MMKFKKRMCFFVGEFVVLFLLSFVGVMFKLPE